MTQASTDASALDRRREKLRKRTAVAEAAAAKVSSLEQQLAANAATSREQDAALRSARDQVAELKKAIKTSKKQLGKLRTARKDARKDDTQARQRARTAEAKYDRAMLADLVQREKQRDLASHTTPTTPAAPAPVPAVAPPAPAVQSAAVEPVAPAAPSATATGARGTRAKAGTSRTTTSARTNARAVTASR